MSNTDVEGATLLSEDDVAELLAFLVTAARTQTDEAPEYGPLRLMTAAITLAQMVPASASPTLRDLATRVGVFPTTLTPAADPDGYRNKLDELCADVADHLMALVPGERK